MVTLTSHERTLASLAHLSVLLGLLSNGVGGALAAVLIWLTQKERSSYVAFQALQAAAYQIVGMGVMTLAWCCWLGFYFATWIPLIPQLEQNPDTLPPLFWIGLASMVVPFAIMGLWVLYGLWAAARVFQGADFRYLLVGRWVEHYLMQRSTIV